MTRKVSRLLIPLATSQDSTREGMSVIEVLQILEPLVETLFVRVNVLSNKKKSIKILKE